MRPTRQHKYQLWLHNYLIVALLQNVLSPLCVTHQAPYLYLTHDRGSMDNEVMVGALQG